MGNGSLRDKRTGRQPRVRSEVARAAHFRNSGGAMGGGKATNNKRDRSAAKQNLRKGEWA